MHGSLIKQAARLINGWYNDSEENQRVRMLLAESFAETWIVVGELLYFVQQGMPSGVAITSVLNSIINWLLITCCIYELLLQGNRLDLFSQENWELALYGDDHVVALKRELQQYVTFQKVKAFMNDLNIGYTDSVKSDRVFDFERIEEVTYLKRTFVVLASGKVLAPLDQVSVENSLNWCQSGHFGVETVTESWNTLCLEAFKHGREYYERLTQSTRNAVFAWCDRNGHDRPLLEADYDIQHTHWLQCYYGKDKI